MRINKITIILVFTSIFTASSHASEVENSVSIKNFVLPSEVKNLGKLSGSIYYNKSIKGKALIPVHFWGEVRTPGLHFVPVDTKFIEALSMAGGPSSLANLEKVKLVRRSDRDVKTIEFDLTEGGSNEPYSTVVKPSDSVFVPRDYWRTDRTYYSSLINVGVTLLTGILIYKQIQDRNGLKISF